MAFRSRWTAILAAGLTATALGAATRPPSKLHLVGDHWTAWDPPTSFPEGAKIHTVVPGDTLWDLAGKYLGNSYLWPQIWEKNQYVLDAHWIYPGDPLVVGIEVAGADDVGATTAEGEGEEGDDRLGTAPAGGRKNVPVPLGSESDIYCSGYIGEEEEAFGWTIVGSEYDALTPTNDLAWGLRQDGMFGVERTLKYKLTLGDVLYISGGRAAGLSAGMVLEAVEPRHVVRHPVTKDDFGRIYSTMGRVRILSVQENGAIGEITQGCDGLRVGSMLRAYQPEPVPLARRTLLRAVNDPTMADLGPAPVILTSVSDIISLGQDHVVYIDRGAQDDVQPGDIFTIYRLNREGLPPVVLGELAVLSSHPRSAVAKILESRFPVYAGDRLERK